MPNCLIWRNTPCDEINRHSESLNRCFSSARAGGRYCITRMAEEILKGALDQKGNQLQATLSRWIYEKNLLGETPEISSGIVTEAKKWRVPPVSKRIDYLLKFLGSKTKVIRQAIPQSPEMQAATLVSLEQLPSDDLLGLMKLSEEMGYIRILKDIISAVAKNEAIAIDYSGGTLENFAQITAKGYQRLEELEGTQATTDQAFVAMWLDKSMDKEWNDGFEPAIKDAGYRPLRIDRKEHNNKIDDEIIAEIKRSRFLVADFTSKHEKVRGGVYYEAGFAQGLNIPVIFTCRKEQCDDIHFDTQQFNHIFWENSEDLRKRLKDRIAATIGDGPHRNNE